MLKKIKNLLNMLGSSFMLVTLRKHLIRLEVYQLKVLMVNKIKINIKLFYLIFANFSTKMIFLEKMSPLKFINIQRKTNQMFFI